MNPTQTIDGPGPLIAALPIMGIGQAGDFVRLHESEEYWSDELTFVSVPIDGEKQGKLHLIEDSLAVAYLPVEEDQALSPGASDEADGGFFLPLPDPNP